MIINENILKDKELTKFIIEELNKYPFILECFSNPDYEYTQEEINSYTDEQIEYLLESLNDNISDAIYEGEEAVKIAETKYNNVKEMIKNRVKN